MALSLSLSLSLLHVPEHAHLNVSVKTSAHCCYWFSAARPQKYTVCLSTHPHTPLSDMGLHHKEFEQAGKRAGLQIWRIEKMELVPVPDNLHGNFYIGDAYLVLHTVKQKDSCFYDLHFWLGKQQFFCTLEKCLNLLNQLLPLHKYIILYYTQKCMWVQLNSKMSNLNYLSTLTNLVS